MTELLVDEATSMIDLLFEEFMLIADPLIEAAAWTSDLLSMGRCW